MIVWFSDNGGPVDHSGPYLIVIVDLLDQILIGNYGTNIASNWPLRGSKGSLMEGGTRTPALIYSPNLLPHGETNKNLIHIR